MKRLIVLFVTAILVLTPALSGCSSDSESSENTATYSTLTMPEAAEIISEPEDYILLDVRTAEEFEGGHIPGAINIANEDISSSQPSELPDLEQTIYVYCNSGNRSKQAASKLAAMGYSNIVEIGGIMSWTGPIE